MVLPVVTVVIVAMFAEDAIFVESVVLSRNPDGKSVGREIAKGPHASQSLSKALQVRPGNALKALQTKQDFHVSTKRDIQSLERRS